MGVGVIASSVVTSTAVDVLMEPFNNFTDAPWTLQPTPTIVTGRTGTAAQFATTGARADYTIPAINESDTLTVGFAYRATVITAAQRSITQFYSDTNTLQHNILRHDGATGQLNFYRGSATVIASSATGLIAVNTWYYIEVQAKLGDSPNGTVTVRLNGSPVITATGLDTKNGGTKTVYDTLRLGVGVSSNTNQYDDLYLTMGAGAAFKGSITIP